MGIVWNKKPLYSRSSWHGMEKENYINPLPAILTGNIVNTRALIVQSHDDRGVCALIVKDVMDTIEIFFVSTYGPVQRRGQNHVADS